VDGGTAVRLEGGPPAGPTAAGIDDFFDACVVVGLLDNHVGVESEEQGRTIGICRGRALSWAELWPEFKHYDSSSERIASTAPRAATTAS
jgi:hypothetical protein